METNENVVKAVSEQFLDEQERMRHQLLEAMSGYSEMTTCASWSEGLDRRLHDQGGIWELIATETGWPVDVGGSGKPTDLRWLTWYEAGAVYKKPREEMAHWATEAVAHGLSEEGLLRDCGG